METPGIETPELDVPIVSIESGEVGRRKLDTSVFGAEENTGLMQEAVRLYRNRLRAGCHKTKTRGEVSGGGRKPYKQKGTGNARAGSNTSPVWVGGGIAHGPKLRSYDFQMNKKERRLAVCSALSSRLRSGDLTLVDGVRLNEDKTREAAKFLATLGVKRGAQVVLVVSEVTESLNRAFRNIPGVTLRNAMSVNIYDILVSRRLLIAEEALGDLSSRLGSGA